jgi:hypothetical protein
MRTSAFGRAFAIALLYVAVFVFLVVLQFPSAGPIAAVAGGVSFKALPGGEGKGIRSAELSSDGLQLVFSDRHPLTLIDGAGKETASRPLSYETLEDGFSIRFDHDARLIVTAAPEGRTTWKLELKRGVAAAAMRYELAYGATLLAPGDDGALRLSFGGSTYSITGVASGDTPRTLKIQASKGVIRPFVSLREVESKPAAQAPFIAQTPLDPAAWSRELSAWQDKAWAALSGPSFDAAQGAWSPQAGSPGAFDEPSFIAYMAEALRRDRREAAAALVSVVRSAQADKLTWKSVPFAGRTAGSMAAFEESSLAEVKAIERLLQSRSPSLFYRDGIVPALFDRAPYSLAQEAMSFARSADFSKADAREAVALINAYLDARKYLDDAENPFGRAVELVDRAIVPAIRKVEGNFYLQTGPEGRCDVLFGLGAGKTLVRLAEAVGKPIYAGIGHSLVVSLLKLASDDGSMPATITIADGNSAVSQERLPAAVAYPSVADSPYYPRAVSFFKQLGPGSWAWTSSPSVRVEASPEKTVIFAEYPVGSSHYMAMYGVKPFVKIQLYGLDYNMDAGFESYNASGYFYKKAAGAMYLKMRHKALAEDIRLFY